MPAGCLVLALSLITFAQYGEEEAQPPPDTTAAEIDTTIVQYEDEEAPPQDTAVAASDSIIVPDTMRAVEVDQEALDRQRIDNAVAMATTWVRRLILRGWMNPTKIGAWARYSLTNWSDGSGSYGPVEATVTIHYLGPAEWLGREAESVQAAVQLLDGEHTLVEFDFVLPASQRVAEFYRALIRVDREELRSTTMALPPGAVDYDVLDKPVTAGRRTLTIYTGEFDAEVYRGSGSEGSEVITYRSAAVPPLEIIVLGYGDMGLTFSASGSDPTPRIKSTLPPSR